MAKKRTKKVGQFQNYVVAADASNMGSNAVIRDPSGQIFTVYEPSVRAPIRDTDRFGLAAALELKRDWVCWRDHYYVIGDGVLSGFKRSDLEFHQGKERAGSDFQRFQVACLMARSGIRSGKIDLVLFAPPGEFQESRSRIRKTFLTDSEEVIRLKGDDRDRVWEYQSVEVFPEGMAALGCFLFDTNAKLRHPELVAGNVVVVDIGGRTLNIIQTVDGELVADNRATMTYPDLGLRNQVLEPVLRWTHDNIAGSGDVTLFHIDAAFRSSKKILYHGSLNQPVDLRDVFTEYVARHANAAKAVIDSDHGGFDFARMVLPIGGGGLAAGKYFRQWYGDKVIDRTGHRWLKDIHPVEMNAMGGLCFFMGQHYGEY